MSKISEWDLPKPPVPNLTATIERYLDGLRAVIEPSQYKKTMAIAAEFVKAGGEGETLQRHLTEYAAQVDNYVTNFWLANTHLRNQAPLPINSNPFFMFPKQTFASDNDQFKYAARFIAFSISYKTKLEKGDLLQEYASGHGKGSPLSMATYHHFFTGYRRPGKSKDSQYFAKNSKHIVVATNNQLFVLYLPEEKIPNERSIADSLRQISKASAQESPYPPIGVLTTAQRTEWANIFELMKEDNTNKSSLQMIEDCLYVLCLDGKNEISKGSMPEQTYAAHHLLHGFSTEISSGNRWYDKCFQIVITRDGISGIILEHSFTEEITVLNFCEEFLNFLEKEPEKTAKEELLFNRLRWNITVPITAAIQAASDLINNMAKDLDLSLMRFKEYGKNFIKTQKVSPDVFIQLALQLTFYKIHGALVSTYESASLRKFRYGRLDSIRASHKQALNWIESMHGEKKKPLSTSLGLFKEAIAKQTEILLYTINGEGPDNHLMCLREVAKLKELPEPSLYLDKSYKDYLNFRLSTSQLPTKRDIIVGYGAAVPDGYGVGYNPGDEHIHFCIMCFRSSSLCEANTFSRNLKYSLNEMKAMHQTLLRKKR